MQKLNCWKFMKCGREAGGDKVSELGVCPAATETRTDGLNSGKNGGRACWVIAGTFCDGERQGTYATKFKDCVKCEFYQVIRREEGFGYKSSKSILEVLR